MQNLLKQYIHTNRQSFDVLCISTNKIQQFEYKEKEYILKTQIMNADKLTPYWQMMKEVFHSTFRTQRRNIGYICDLLHSNPHIETANIILADENDKYTVFEKMKGSSWELDEFPDNQEICFQLGQYIGFNHRHWVFQKGGMIDDQFLIDPRKQLLQYVEKYRLLKSSNISEDFIALYTKTKNNVSPSCANALIMADISANQFLFNENTISACVDLDSYVLGPLEWELAVISHCVPNMEAFVKGYETYQSFPKINETAELFGYIMS